MDQAEINCEHMIQMSFDKINLSRRQRGGVRLHRSLLVLQLLQKAREEQIRCLSAATFGPFQFVPVPGLNLDRAAPVMFECPVYDDDDDVFLEDDSSGGSTLALDDGVDASRGLADVLPPQELKPLSDTPEPSVTSNPPTSENGRKRKLTTGLQSKSEPNLASGGALKRSCLETMLFSTMHRIAGLIAAFNSSNQPKPGTLRVWCDQDSPGQVLPPPPTLELTACH